MTPAALVIARAIAPLSRKERAMIFVVEDVLPAMLAARARPAWWLRTCHLSAAITIVRIAKA